MRIWGRPTTEPKWDTSAIAAHSNIIPCRVGQEECRYSGGWTARNVDLRKRMRMGDVFDDWVGTISNRHVVALYYFDPTNNNEPYYYEETVGGDCRARLHKGGWSYLETYWGWWNGTDGYRPLRYWDIRDDLYFPWLSHNWFTWESTLYFRNNNAPANLWPEGYVMQHSLYCGPGTDQSAVETLTLRRPNRRDVWELPTSMMNPRCGEETYYVGGGVAAADAGSGALIYMEVASTHAQAYTGIFPFDSLGMGVSEKAADGYYYLYMPFFMYYSPSLYSKIFVQNVSSSQNNDITVTYWPDAGEPCIHSQSLPPMAWTIFDVNACQWPGGAPSTKGAAVVRGTQPLAGITHEVRGGVISAYNAFSRGAQTLYAPSLVRDYYGWHSRTEIQNVGPDPANITVSYYANAPSTTPLCSNSYTVSPNRHVEVNQGGYTCLVHLPNPPNIFAAVITANQPIVATIDQISAGAFQTHNALIAGKTILLLPFVRNGMGNWGDNWDAAITVQNTTSFADNDVTLWLYDQAGNQCSSKTKRLGARETYVFYSELDSVQCGGVPTDFSGSIVITSDYAVAATANLYNGSLYDGAVSYSAIEWKDIATK